MSHIKQSYDDPIKWRTRKEDEEEGGNSLLEASGKLSLTSNYDSSGKDYVDHGILNGRATFSKMLLRESTESLHALRWCIDGLCIYMIYVFLESSAACELNHSST